MPDSAPLATAAQPEAPALPLWRRVVPFVFGFALVAFVVTRLDLPAFFRAVRRTNYVAFVGFAAVFMVTLLAADVLATRYVYRRTIGPVRYRELFVVRAASYLPSLVNHHLGQAWLTYFLSKAYRAPLARTAGATLLVYATTFGALFVFLLAGLPFHHQHVAWLRPMVVVVAVAAVGYAAVLLVRPRLLTERAVAAPLFEMGLGGHLEALLFRLPHVGVQFLGAWVPFLLFGVDVPFVDALSLMPVLMFVVTLPVSPQGLGTRDTAAILLFSTYAHGAAAERSAAIAATTLSWLAVLTLLQLAFFPFFLRPAQRLLGRDAARQADPATAPGVH